MGGTLNVERYECILLALYNCGQDSDIHSIVCAGLYHKLSHYSLNCGHSGL